MAKLHFLRSGGGAGGNIGSTTASNQLSQNTLAISSLVIGGLNNGATINQYGNTGGSSGKSDDVSLIC